MNCETFRTVRTYPRVTKERHEKSSLSMAPNWNWNPVPTVCNYVSSQLLSDK